MEEKVQNKRSSELGKRKKGEGGGTLLEVRKEKEDNNIIWVVHLISQTITNHHHGNRKSNKWQTLSHFKSHINCASAVPPLGWSCHCHWRNPCFEGRTNSGHHISLSPPSALSELFPWARKLTESGGWLSYFILVNCSSFLRVNFKIYTKDK